jgi:hypothetical protein
VDSRTDSFGYLSHVVVDLLTLLSGSREASVSYRGHPVGRWVYFRPINLSRSHRAGIGALSDQDIHAIAGNGYFRWRPAKPPGKKNDAPRSGHALPGHLPALVATLAPAVNAVQGTPGDLLANAIRRNVMINVEKLKGTAPILKSLVDERKIRVVGGIYELKTGQVELLG